MATIKNIEDLELSEITEELLLDECIDMGADLGVDTNQGSIYRDASDGHIIRVAKFFNDLNLVADIISINTCTGDILDERLKERGMERNPPADTPAVYYVEFVGAEPEVGDVVSCDGYFFTVEKVNERWAIRSSEETGTDMNHLVFGLPVIPERDVDNLISATLQELAIPAVDMEDDDSARERFINKISGPSENGNKAQIRSWCEALEGVGRARIIPLWKGEGTALGIIISTQGTKPTDAVVELVQETIDPGAEGMGEGMATIGCHFTAIAVEEVKIDIVVNVFAQDSTYQNIQEEIQAAAKDYLKGISLRSDASDIVVRYNSIGAIVAGISSIVDYDELLINGGTDNVVCTQYQVPVIGEVKVNGGV